MSIIVRLDWLWIFIDFLFVFLERRIETRIKTRTLTLVVLKLKKSLLMASLKMVSKEICFLLKFDVSSLMSSNKFPFTLTCFTICFDNCAGRKEALYIFISLVCVSNYIKVFFLYFFSCRISSVRSHGQLWWLHEARKGYGPGSHA